jgi:hypothetical protein
MNLYKWAMQLFTIFVCLITLFYSNDPFTNIVIGIMGFYISYTNWRES